MTSDEINEAVRKAARALLDEYDQAKLDTAAVLRMSKSVTSAAELFALDFEPPTIRSLRAALALEPAPPPAPSARYWQERMRERAAASLERHGRHPDREGWHAAAKWIRSLPLGDAGEGVCPNPTRCDHGVPLTEVCNQPGCSGAPVPSPSPCPGCGRSDCPGSLDHALAGIACTGHPAPPPAPSEEPIPDFDLCPRPHHLLLKGEVCPNCREGWRPRKFA